MKFQLPPRRLIPKWRPVALTLKNAESQPSIERKPSEFNGDAEEFEKAVALWRQTMEPGVLGDVLSFTVHPDLQNKAIDIGREAVRVGAKVTTAQVSLIQDVIDEPMAAQLENMPFQKPIQQLRNILRNTPDNPLALLDYAQFQLALGKEKAAERSLKTALSLVPNNRLVLRTMARFLVHSNEYSRAHSLIQRHPCTPYDPWLIASEIALAEVASTKSRFLMIGSRMANTRHDIHSGHLTELLGVIATEELSSGRLKRARDSQMRALAMPNDNVIAQAVMYRAEFGIDPLNKTTMPAFRSSNEALTLKAMMDFDPEGMVQHAKNWHTEEPFSSRPIRLLASTYACTGDFDIALNWVLTGLLADHDDPGLLISLAYIQARRGRDMESFAAMRRVSHISTAYHPYCLATEGMIKYIQGRFDEGDALYNQAIFEFDKVKRPDLSTFCLTHQAFSALDFNHPREGEIITKAQKAIETNPSGDALLLLRTRSSIKLVGAHPGAKKMRRMSQWEFDSKTNTLSEKIGLTEPGVQSLIVINRR